MKKIFLGLLLIIQVLAESKKLTAVITNARFFSASEGPYIEMYHSVSGLSVNYVRNASTLYQAAISINIVIKDSNNMVVYKDGYNLLSPEISDTNDVAFNFIDQKRVGLKNGLYNIETRIRDVNSDQKEYKVFQNVLLDFDPGKVAISDIVLVDSYSKTEKDNLLSKNGFDLVPYVDNFYPKAINKLTFYAEIYNTSGFFTQPYLLTYHIETDESHQILEAYRVNKKQTPEPVTPLLTEFEISDLVSGNFKLMLEVRDRENNLVAYNDLFFQRSNAKKVSEEVLRIENLNVENTWVSKYTNKDTLIDYIACLRPISNAEELIWQDTQLKIAQPKLMQQYIYDFWFRRNRESPEAQWIKYKEQVDYVNAVFGTSRVKGYFTDRGRVYLQYGPPNTTVENLNEPDAYPYQIWHYYKIKTFSNRRFIFYSTDLTSKYFQLLSSDMQGEFYDNQWQMKIYKRNTQTNDMDIEKRRQNFGNTVEDMYNNPH